MASPRVLLLVASLSVALTSRAADFGIRVEAGGASALSKPQSERFGLGFGGTLGGSLALLDAFDLGAHATYNLLPPSPGNTRTGSATLVGVSARTHFALGTAQWTPTLEAGPSYLLTGGQSRFALELAAGAMVKLSDSGLWLGASVRFAQLFHLVALPGVQGFDATLLNFGLSLEYASAQPPPPASAPPLPPVEPPADDDPDHDGVRGAADVCPKVAEDKDGFEDTDGCPDLDDDQDGVVDAADSCPRKAGPAPDGCPVFTLITVTAKGIELRQKIYFAFGQATILPKSHFLLGEVVSALNDRPTVCVRIEGHTDSVGSSARNLELSKDRAASVRDFLVAAGVSTKRVVSEGYGDTQPRESNATADGRENNRRVEFVIIPCPE